MIDHLLRIQVEIDEMQARYANSIRAMEKSNDAKIARLSKAYEMKIDAIIARLSKAHEMKIEKALNDFAECNKKVAEEYEKKFNELKEAYEDQRVDIRDIIEVIVDFGTNLFRNLASTGIPAYWLDVVRSTMMGVVPRIQACGRNASLAP